VPFARPRPKRASSLQQPWCQHALQAVFGGVHDQPAGAGHGAHEVMELAFDGGEVVEDVRVVELEVVQHAVRGR
jgi:hypothetical protein